MDELIEVNLLPDEVFCNIFNYLDVNELVNCEMVCHRWRAIVLYNWKKFYLQKVKSDVMWRQYSKSVRFNHQTASSTQFRQFCFKVQLLDTNWRTATFQTTHLGYSPAGRFKMDDDYMITFDEDTLNIYEVIAGQVEQVAVPHFTPVAYHIHDNIIMFASRQIFRVFDAKTSQQINEFPAPDRCEVVDFDFVCNGLVVAVTKLNTFQLTFWRMNDPRDIVHLHHLPVTGQSLRMMAMDEHFVVVVLTARSSNKCFTIFHLISIQTLQVESSMTAVKCTSVYYKQRCLVTINFDNIMRVMNVSSGTWSPSIDLKTFNLKSFITINANSRYLVAMSNNLNTSRCVIFDLNALRDATCVVGHTLFEVSRIWDWWMNETRLACITGPCGSRRRTVFNFAPK